VALLNPANSFRVKTRYPVNNGSDPANPHDILVLSSEKAYVTLYEPPYNSILIVDPDTGAEVGRVNFTGGGTNADGLPRLDKMIYLQGWVWVLMQNINASFTEYGPGAIGVVNPTSDAIEDIIELDLKNPVDFGYDGEVNLLYVAATGDWADPITGGVEAVNPVRKTSAGVRIGGDALGGFVTRMVMKDAHKAYLAVFKSDYSGTKVVEVDPEGGTLGSTLYECSGYCVYDLALDEGKRLLIADQANSQVILMDLETQALETFNTLVPPVSLAIWESKDKL
jgi:hypothetical protein